MAVRYASMTTDADLIIVWGGTNDFGHNIPLGTIADTSILTEYGAINTIIDGIVAANPTSLLMFMTPTIRDVPIQYGTGANALRCENKQKAYC